MKSLKSYVNESSKSSIKVATDEFSKDMTSLSKGAKDEVGYEEISYVLASTMGEFTDNYEMFFYKKSDKGLLNLLYVTANYDLVALSNGKVDVRNSNNKIVAKILRKYATPEMIQKVEEKLK